MAISRWFCKIQIHTIVCILLIIFVEAYCSELKILIVVGRHINLKNSIIDKFNNGVKIYGWKQQHCLDSIRQLSVA